MFVLFYIVVFVGRKAVEDMQRKRLGGERRNILIMVSVIAVPHRCAFVNSFTT
jgi:hypothetical protein